jgi:superfamily II DNA or RNA helicase
MSVVPTEYADELYIETIANEESPVWVSMVNRMFDPQNPAALERYRLIWRIVSSICKDESARVLVLSDRVEACQFMAARFACMGLRAGLLIGSPENRKELDRTIGGLRSGLVQVGCGTTVADEGLDVPPLTHVVLTAPCYSNEKRVEQMTGRAARVYGTKKAGHSIYIWDRRMFPAVPIDDVRRERLERGVLNKLRQAVGDRVSIVSADEFCR